MENTGLTIRKHVEDVEKFINYNLDLGNITKDTTVQGLLDFISITKEHYIPMIERIEKYLEDNLSN